MFDSLVAVVEMDNEYEMTCVRLILSQGSVSLKALKKLELVCDEVI